jgi:hypothetical protein
VPDIETLIEWQLRDGSVWLDRDAVHPHDGLIRAIRTAGAERPAFAAAVLRLLPSPDLRVRTGTVAALPEVVGHVGAGAVAAVLRDHEALFHGVRPAWPIGAADLEEAAASAVAAAVKPGDGVVWLRDVARHRPWGANVLGGLARADGEWLVAHARTLVPHRALGVLAELPPRLRAPLIAALSPYPPEEPSPLSRFFWSRFPPEEAARLRALMWPGA